MLKGKTTKLEKYNELLDYINLNKIKGYNENNDTIMNNDIQYDDMMVSFNMIKGNKCYYCYLEKGSKKIELEYAGKLGEI